jgi:signal transduction histidine kinase
VTVGLERAVLESLRDNVAVLDTHGNILAVNKAWDDFARDQGLESLATVGIGSNYLEVCRVAAVQSDPYAQAALAGIESVIDGSSDFFEMEYPCHSPKEKRWFHVTVTRLRTSEGGVVVAHRNISDRRRAEQQLRASEEALRQSQQKIRDLAGRLLEAQEAERERIARELHDDLSQKLVALSLALSAFNKKLPESAVAMRDDVTDFRRRTNELSDDVRQLSHRLHPTILEHVGLAAGLHSVCRDFSKDGALNIRLDTDEVREFIPPEAALCLYRVAQEGLLNINKHAQAKEVLVKLVTDKDGFQLFVSDDGNGFEVGGGGKPRGLGLLSMEERVRLLDGSLQIQSQLGKGTDLRARLPNKQHKA